ILVHLLLSLIRRRPTSPLFPYTTLFRSEAQPTVLLYQLQQMSQTGNALELLYAGFTACVQAFAAHLREPEPDCNQNQKSERHSRSEEHTSELQSRENLVCRLLLEKKKNK